MTASDKVIVIVSPGYFELDSIVQISKTIEEVKAYFNPDIELAGFLFTMSDPTINSKFFCSFFLMVKEAMAQAIR